MAGPTLRPDIAPSRAESAVAPRARPHADAAPERDRFEQIQQDLAKKRSSSGRGETARHEAPAGPKEKAAIAGKGESKPESHKREPGLNEAAAQAGIDEKVNALPADLAEVTPDAADEDLAALFLPLAGPVGDGRTLPSGGATSGSLTPVAGPSSGSGQPGVPGLRQLFMQVTQGGKGTEEAAGGLSDDADLQSFKSSLTDVLESRGSRSSEAPPLTLTGSQRGMELREGSALVRQYSTTVETPVQQGEWGDKVAGKISWLAGQGISFAEIHINPPDMGPIDVRVSVQNDQATVAVHAQNASVRDLLELNGHRLREMMQENGMNLARMDVSDQPAQQQQTAGEESGKGGTNAGGEGEESGLVSTDGEPISTGDIHMQWQDQVDTYA